jgi:hypothetical protein
MALTAAQGFVRWGYFEAAALENVVMTPDGDDKTRCHVVGHVLRANAAYLAQQPLVFVLPTVQQDFTWPIASHAINDEDTHGIIFRAIVGLPDKGDTHGGIVARPS